jgi:pimeloyl-ACP methyl ester carboxylesterase
VRRDYADARFGQIHYRIAQPEKPSKTPLICFHMSPSSGRIYGQLLSEMGKDRIAIAPDTPGFGDSNAPAEPPEIEDYAAAMGDLLDALDIGEVDVMGYHTGSKIALELALQRPAQVRRCILVSAPIYTEEELSRQRRDYSGREPDDAGKFLQASWDGQSNWKSKDATSLYLHREIAESLRAGDALPWGHRAAFNYLHAENLPKASQPITILCPKDDLYEQTLRATEYLNNGQVVEMPDWAGHGMLDTHTEEVAEILRSIFDSDEAASAPGDGKPTPDQKAGTDIGFTKRFINGPSGQLHLRLIEPEDATAIPFFCLHSSPNSGRIYEAILQTLGKERAVVAVDTPGFGESEAPAEPPEIEDYARAIIHVIEALGYGQVDLMGYHTGSETCVEVARQRPDLIRKIVMNSAPIFSDEELEEFRGLYSPPSFSDDGSHLVKRWLNMIPFYGPTVPRNILLRNYAEGLRGGPISHWGHRAAFNYPMLKRMGEIDQEMLIINLDDDLTEQTKRAEGNFKNGRIHTIKTYGHAWFDVITDDAAQILRDFLDA